MSSQTQMLLAQRSQNDSGHGPALFCTAFIFNLLQVHAVEGLLRKRVAKYWAAAAVANLKAGANVLQMHKCPLPLATLLAPPSGGEKHGCTLHLNVARTH